MKHNVFAIWLKIVIAGATLIGLAIAIFLIPFLGGIFERQYPELAYWVVPWMVIIYITAVPCFVAMGICWKIASNIGKNNSFCMQNARLFKLFSRLALGNCGFFFTASLVLFLVGMNHPGMILAELLILFIGMAIYACTSALSYLVEKAAKLQEDNDLTI